MARHHASGHSFKHGLAAFIDLLGFGAKTKAASQDEDRLGDLVNAVRTVHELFEHSSSRLAQGNDLAQKKTLAFSDSLVVLLPEVSPAATLEGIFDVLVHELDGLALAQGTCVNQGIFLRGGIDFGLWYHKGDVLVSPALVSAYQCERTAVVPVLAITDTLYQYMRAHPGRRHYSESSDPISDLFSYCSINGKRTYFLDYAKICAMSVDWDHSPGIFSTYRKLHGAARHAYIENSYREAIGMWLAYHRGAILDARQASLGDPRVRKKYDWLVRYHNRTVSYFKVPDPESLKIRQADLE